MTDDERLTWDFILEVLDVMERHGYHRSDNQHTGQAIGLLGNLAHVYEGAIGAPRGAYVAVPPSRPTPAQPPGRDGHKAVSVPADQVRTLLAALDEAADYKRDRAGTCADCADQSCATCQWRLQTARDYDQMAAQLLHTAEASAATAGQPGQNRAEPSRGQPQTAADREAGQ